MNRSILIVICDFLLVSLLAFSTVDINKVADEGARNIKTEMVTNQVDTSKDLTAVMRMALDEERKNRMQLLGELTRTREAMGQQQALLTDREKQVQTVQQQLQTREQEAQRLQQEQASLQQRFAETQTRFAEAQTNLATLNQQLHSAATESVLSKERLAAMQAEAKKQSDEAAALQQRLAQLASSNAVVLAERQQLAGQLQVAQAEKRAAAEQVARMTEEVKVEREEKAKLAEGVKALATKSDALAQEVRENRPLAPNTIFFEFATNRVDTRFTASRSGLFGTTKSKDAETVLVSDGQNTYALCHIQDTPLTLFSPGTDWEGLAGSLTRGPKVVPVRSLSFHLQDPRVVFMPVSAADARDLGCKIYRISSDPFKFQDAVLVGTRESYYGECRFELDLGAPEYLRLDRNVIKGLFGKFNPSRGDLVFSRTGELLGVMANDTYCLIIHNFPAGATINFTNDVRAQHTGVMLATLYSQVSQLPAKLQ